MRLQLVVPNKALKQRAIYVYLPSVKMAEDWKGLAAKAGVPTSKFVAEHVENSLRQEDKSGHPSRIEMIKQLREKDEELMKLRKENRLLRTLVEKLDIELKRYRAQPFLEEEFQGKRTYDRELVHLIKGKKMIDSDRLLSELGVDPKETDIVKAVNRQLQNLEAYGLIESTARGWMWKG